MAERHVQFVGQPAIEAGLGQIENLARGLDLAIENLKTILPGPQIKVQTGDVGGDHDIDPVARLLERFGGIGLRLDAARDLAEHVDLPLGVETADPVDALETCAVVCRPQRLRRPALGFVGPGADATARRAIDLGQRLAADDDELQSRLLQTVQRDLEIEIVLQRALDEAVQLRVVQRPPPLPPIRARAAGRRFLDRGLCQKGSGQCGIRRLIVRTDGASRQQTGKYNRASRVSYSHTLIPEDQSCKI